MLLGLVGSMLNRHYRITPFDERYEQEIPENLCFLNYMRQVNKHRIHGYVNPSIRERADYLMEEHGMLLNNPL